MVKNFEYIVVDFSDEIRVHEIFFLPLAGLRFP